MTYNVLKYSDLLTNVFFFFASRRRHTRYWRDWSSDVCSSDLEKQLRFGFAEALAQAKGRGIIVEEYFAGHDHRILVVGGKLIAVSERIPAHVIGDGVHTIGQLIEEVNKDPRRGEGHEKVMTRIKVDAHVIEYLGRSGLTIDSVPAAGDVVMLRATANLSTGGTAVDRTNEIHFDNAEIARRAAMIIGLDIEIGRASCRERV